MSTPTQAKKKIIVFPATGWQGRSICERLSKDAQYEVIGIARNTDGPKANSEYCTASQLHSLLLRVATHHPARMLVLMDSVRGESLRLGRQIGEG